MEKKSEELRPLLEAVLVNTDQGARITGDPTQLGTTEFFNVANALRNLKPSQTGSDVSEERILQARSSFESALALCNADSYDAAIINEHLADGLKPMWGGSYYLRREEASAMENLLRGIEKFGAETAMPVNTSRLARMLCAYYIARNGQLNALIETYKDLDLSKAKVEDIHAYLTFQGELARNTARMRRLQDRYNK